MYCEEKESESPLNSLKLLRLSSLHVNKYVRNCNLWPLHIAKLVNINSIATQSLK